MSVKGFLDKYFKEVPIESEGRNVKPITPYQRSSVLDVLGLKEERPLEEVKPKSSLNIFTDGACSDNGRRGARGGFGVHVYSKPGFDLSVPLMKNEPQTNNRAELRGIQAAIDLIEKYENQWSYDSYCIWTDSEYSINSLTKWAVGWRRNGWKKSDGGLIQNIDLIKPIYEKLGRHSNIHLRYVKAHQQTTAFPYDGNNEADRLARQSIIIPIQM